MGHIKNSPKLRETAPSAKGEGSPVLRLDLQHPNEIGELTPWQVDFRQLGAGRLSTAIASRRGRAASVLEIRMNERVHQQGASPDSWTTLGIPKLGTVDVWQGQDIDQEVLLSFGDGEGFDGVTSAGFKADVVSFDTRRFEAFVQACGFDMIDDNSLVRRMVDEVGVLCLNRLQRHISGILGQTDGPLTPAAEETLMLDVVTLLNRSVVHRDKSRAANRRRALVRAIELMSENLEGPISIEEICRRCGASWRTLDRAFNEQFGQGPKTYYTRMRLGRVREDILKGSATYPITDAANRIGFWHMGQFARDYRLFFGELPSQTRSGCK